VAVRGVLSPKAGEAFRIAGVSHRDRSKSLFAAVAIGATLKASNASDTPKNDDIG
jgi:hypothetical protein